MKKLSQDQPLNSTRFLFASKASDLRGIIADGIRSGDDLLRFFSTHSSALFHAMDYIIMNYHQTDSGRITTGMLMDAIHDVAETYEMAQYSISQLSKSSSVEQVSLPEGEHAPFAIGVLDEDFQDSDKDPYLTAGGYRNWIALKGTRVEYVLNHDLSVQAFFDSNCVVDHYNNNFAGNSTGGGTTHYKTGERVEKRSVNMHREWNYWEWKKPAFRATVLQVDAKLAGSLAKKYVPEFAFLFDTQV